MPRALVSAVLLLVASPALACPVCGGGGPNQQAFIDTTIFLSLFPLGLMGGVALYYRKHLRENGQPSARSEDAYVPQVDAEADQITG